MYSNKGGYALLLGSGVSRAAGIPTGWDITLDLIRKIATTRGEDIESDPVHWYKSAVEEKISYSGILRQLARSKAERQRLLGKYFEPSEDERRDGVKIPTAGHRAIARLVADGFVRVILTTNFDRLIEQALSEAGVTPTVVSSSSQAQGALPLVHQRALLIKIHGDYLDTNVKNTEEELSSYDRNMRRLVGQVVNDFGLVICGWSAEWDTALRAELEKATGRRFSTFWCARGKLGDAAQQVVRIRSAQTISIDDADSFFELLAERITSLADYDRPHPLSAAIAVETLKRYLDDKRKRTKLFDLVHDETERVFEVISSPEHSPARQTGSDQTYIQRIEALEAAQETLEQLLIAGCFYGDESSIEIWAKSLERTANPPQANESGLVDLVRLYRYPAVRLLYAGGLAAVAAQRFPTLFALLTYPVVRGPDAQAYKTPTEVLCVNRILNAERLNHELGKRDHVPGSERLFSSLRERLRRCLPSDEDFDETFDLFEFLLAAQHYDAEAKDDEENGRYWVPVGRFGYKLSLRRVEQLAHDSSRLQVEILSAGFFGGSNKRLRRAIAAVEDYRRRLQRRW